ncbi:isochorismatase family cysteine hydrolase [Pseudomonas sp. BN102]|uniref:isochorismatase family cysteine hydrolase n=1 Tax=Pseudomonas sp. BN102 TaxID=2567886 RepID=UPI002455F7D1|nr:isochorismatase family cysteine hydrolase [Pseudomonas sp. BN102]MDH4606969.1 cysteine hydrolase [Pseudomonas sp. BN102]
MRNDIAYLIIDMQQEDGFRLHDIENVIDNSAALIASVRSAGIPLIYTRHINDAEATDLPPGEPLDANGRPASYCAGTRQVQILPRLAPQPGDCVIDKPRYSAFHRTDLDAQLKRLGIGRLMISGVLTDACVLATVLDAFALGYRVDLIVDACTTTTRAAHYAALLILANWVYAIELFATEQYLRALRGEPFTSCRPQVPDQFAHQPTQFVETIALFESSLGLQRRDQE